MIFKQFEGNLASGTYSPLTLQGKQRQHSGEVEKNRDSVVDFSSAAGSQEGGSTFQEGGRDKRKHSPGGDCGKPRSSE